MRSLLCKLQSQRAQLARRGISNPTQTNTPQTCSVPQELHFQPLPEDISGTLGQEMRHNQLAVGRGGWRGLQGFPEGSHASISSLFSAFHSIASPAKCAPFALQRHKAADGKLSTGNQRFLLHLPLSFKHKTQARTEGQEATKANFYPSKPALIRNKPIQSEALKSENPSQNCLKNKPGSPTPVHLQINKEHSWTLCQLCTAHSCQWCVNTKHTISQDNPPAGQSVSDWWWFPRAQGIVSSLGLTHSTLDL